MRSGEGGAYFSESKPETGGTGIMSVTQVMEKAVCYLCQRSISEEGVSVIFVSWEVRECVCVCVCVC